MTTPKLISLQGAIKRLPQYEAALECLWETQEWEEYIELGVFLQAWTKCVEDATKTKLWLESQEVK